MMQASLHAGSHGHHLSVPRQPAAAEPERMGLSAANSSDAAKRPTKKTSRSNRCSKIGHFTTSAWLRRAPVGAGHLTGAVVSCADIEHVIFAAPGEDGFLRRVKQSGSSITPDVVSQRASGALRALVDTGASSNFARAQRLAKMVHEELDVPRTRLSVCLATGSVVHVNKRMVRVKFRYRHKRCRSDFIVLDLEDWYDFIIGIPWVQKYQPTIGWDALSVGWSPASETDKRPAESVGPAEISSAQSRALTSCHDLRSNAAGSVRDCASKSPDRLDVKQSRRDLAPPSPRSAKKGRHIARPSQGSAHDARRTRRKPARGASHPGDEGSRAGVLGVRIALDSRGHCREQGDRAAGDTVVRVPALDGREHCREQEMRDAGASAAGVQLPDIRVLCCSANMREDAPRVEEPGADNARRRAMASVSWSGHAREDHARNAHCREGN
ncbi:hypothetical protein PybrP1_003790, partial [[Pythium] brassicae (nom. inval.)]